MRDMLKSVSWPGALVVIAFLGLIGWLYTRGATLEALVAAVLGIMAAQHAQGRVDSQRLTTIEGQTNGINDGLRKQLAAKDAQMLEQAQRHAAERAADARVLAQLAASIMPGVPLPAALTAPPVPVPVSAPPLNGAMVPAQRTDEP